MNDKPTLLLIHFESEFTEGYHANSSDVALARYNVLRDCFGGRFDKVLMVNMYDSGDATILHHPLVEEVEWSYASDSPQYHLCGLCDDLEYDDKCYDCQLASQIVKVNTCHEWAEIPEWLPDYVGQDVILGGGFRGECVATFAEMCEHLGINWDIDDDYIYG